MKIVPETEQESQIFVEWTPIRKYTISPFKWDKKINKFSFLESYYILNWNIFAIFIGFHNQINSNYSDNSKYD